MAVDDVTSSSHTDPRPVRDAVPRVLAGTPLPVRLVVTLVCLAGVAVAAGRPWAWRVSLPELPALPTPTDVLPQPTPEPVPSPEPYPSGEPSPIGRTIVVVLAVLAATALLALLVWAVVRVIRALRGTELEDMPETPAPLHGDVDAEPTGLARRAITDAVELALARLDAAATPHDAVIAAWLEFEAAAARHGVTREPTETATEFTTRLLLERVGSVVKSAGAQGECSAAVRVPADAVTDLRDLYNTARFTTRLTTPAAVDSARTALTAIALALADERCADPPAAIPVVRPDQPS